MDTIRQTPLPLDAEPDSDRTGVILRRVGHDMRNKLSVLRNSAYYLEMKLGGQNERIDKHLWLLAREVGVLGRMVLDLMDWVAAKPPVLVATEVNALVQRALDETLPPDGLQIERVLAADLPLLRLDADQCARALGNILSYHYATLQPEDRLRLVTRLGPTAAGGRAVLIECSATGAGLEPPQLASLLDARSPDGLDPARMGLLVARRLVAHSGGQVDVDSHPGAGTRFTLTFPLRAT